MGRYILRRVGYMILTFFVVVAFTFLAMKLLPGNPFRNAQKLTDDQVVALKAHYGLDKPIPVQFVVYVKNMLHGDLGESFQSASREVTTIIGEKLPVSMQLGFEAMVVGVIFGILLGILAGIRRGSFLDVGATIISVLGISIPSFVLAVLMQYYFAVQLRWLPPAYWEGPATHVMPVIALAVAVVANIARFLRTELVEVMNQDYMTTAKAKGISNGAVIVKHALRNALIPVVTILGPMTVAIITGSLVIEQIFVIPGIGSLFVSSITTNDYPVIMGITEMFAALFIVVIFIVDLLYGVIDPRIRLAGGDK